MDKVMVMSQETWDMLKVKLAKNALSKTNPMEHIRAWSGVDVIIDDTVEFNHVDVYESKIVYNMVKNGKRSDTADAGDVG